MGCREGDWLGFWEGEYAGWRGLVPHVPGPPQVAQRLQGVLALGPLHTLPHVLCWVHTSGYGTRGRNKYSSRPWEVHLVDLGGSRVISVKMCLVIIWEAAQAERLVTTRSQNSACMAQNHGLAQG